MMIYTCVLYKYFRFSFVWLYCVSAFCFLSILFDVETIYHGKQTLRCILFTADLRSCTHVLALTVYCYANAKENMRIRYGPNVGLFVFFLFFFLSRCVSRSLSHDEQRKSVSGITWQSWFGELYCVDFYVILFLEYVNRMYLLLLLVWMHLVWIFYVWKSSFNKIGLIIIRHW